MAYCKLDDTKRLLRVLSVAGNNQHKVKFSGSYTIPKAYSSNTGSGILKGISSIVDSYAGSELWHITFSSSTAFTLYRGEGTSTPDGTGTISSSFTSTSGIITIAAAQWAGTPITGDQFKFRTDSNISEEDGIGFLEDANEIINGMALEFIDDQYVPFVSPPSLLKRACQYIGASVIFTSVFSNLNTDQVPTLVRRWYNQGKNFVKLYLESIPGKAKFKYSRYARFVSHEPLLQEQIGIKEAAGVENMKGEIETINEQYDYDYNEEEAIGST